MVGSFEFGKSRPPDTTDHRPPRRAAVRLGVVDQRRRSGQTTSDTDTLRRRERIIVICIEIVLRVMTWLERVNIATESGQRPGEHESAC
jgi:hypothetical protein